MTVTTGTSETTMTKPDDVSGLVWAVVLTLDKIEKQTPTGLAGLTQEQLTQTVSAKESEAEELVRKAVELAKAGDVVMLKFLVGRILPRERLIKLDLPRMELADDVVVALGSVMRAVSDGRISPSEGAALATLINSQQKAIDMADVVKRLDSLEAQTNEGRVR